MAAGPRRCRATRTDGEPCRNPVVLESGYCLAHDQEAAASRGFGGAEAARGHGRPRVARFHELALASLERDVESWLAPYLAARDSGDADLAIRAAERLLDRLEGKPTQRQEVEMSGGLDLTLDQLYQPKPNVSTDTPIQEEQEEHEDA